MQKKKCYVEFQFAYKLITLLFKTCFFLLFKLRSGQNKVLPLHAHDDVNTDYIYVHVINLNVGPTLIGVSLDEGDRTYFGFIMYSLMDL